MVLGSLQQPVAAALYGALRPFPGLATLAAEAAQCDSERLDVWGVSVARMASTECGLQLKLWVPLAPFHASTGALFLLSTRALSPFTPLEPRLGTFSRTTSEAQLAHASA